MAKLDKVAQKLSESMKNLHIPGIRAHFEEITKKAKDDSMSYEEYLLALLEKECEVRYNKRINRLLKDSRLPSGKTMENFDMKRLPLKIAQQVKGLLDGKFLDRTENVLIFGNPGSGKTHLICAVCNELIALNRKVCFTTSSLLVQELLIAKRDLQLPKALKKLGKYDAIIIDDIGYVQQEREEMEILFTFLADRYEKSSIMITSNLPFSKWDKIFKDTMIAAAAIDRLVHHSIIIEMNLESYRMKKVKKIKKGGDNS